MIAVGFAGTVPEFSVMMELMLPLLPQSESEVKTVVELWDADLARDASDRLPRVDKPPLVIGGGQDLAAPLWQCRKVPSGSRGPRRRSSPGRAPATQWGLERTEEFLAEVLAFFAAQPAPAATG
ncbi:hypothetical protein [Actinacidiphila oryziradicis]|uniref:Uncharacterized protein n=1 Tax=Actinacidiphila oryziradicis TaxID=2571141 RepID=A0A4U0RGM0_9ACTN|nr:hypothetical protein [Actinacidiphila oryziradicis]TJZ94545.1 hypothetical protein FCI23_53450 [Actinacidiphila oryziradicis]